MLAPDTSTGRIRDAIDQLDAAIAENPDKARAKHAGATATLTGGLKFTVTGPHGEKLETDMAKGVGGEASGPSPGWALRAALASCTGTVIALRAAKLGLSLDKLEVSVDSDGDLRGMLGFDDTVSAGLYGLRMRVAIAAPNASRGELEELVRWGDAHSPVACTLRQALPIAVVIESVDPHRLRPSLALNSPGRSSDHSNITGAFMQQGKEFATSAIKFALPFAAALSAAGLLASPASATHSIRAGIYEEYPVGTHCMTTGDCIIYFDKVNKDLIVDKVFCSLKMKATNNPRILSIVLGRALADKTFFSESSILPAPQILFTGPLIAASMVADTQTVTPADQRTAVLVEIVADAPSVDVTLRCGISGHQP